MGTIHHRSIRRSGITEEPRSRISVSLIGGHAGRISLADLTTLAGGIQETTHRIARALDDRSGRGRSPDLLRRLVELHAVGIRSGSSVIEIEAPGIHPQLPFEERQEDLGLRSLDLLVDALHSVSTGASPPEPMLGAPARTLERTLARLDHYREIRWDEHRAGQQPRTVSVAPSAAAAALRDWNAEPAEQDRATVVGELYQLNLHTNAYTIEDEVRGSVLCEMRDSVDLDQLRSLIGRRVQARGLATFDQGRLIRLVVTELSLSERPYSERFYDYDVASRLTTQPAVSQLESLAIPDLSEAEAEAFRQAIQER